MRNRRVLLGFFAAAPVPIAAMAAVIGVITSLGGVGPDRSGAREAVAVAAEPRPLKEQTIAIAWAGDITPGSAYGRVPGGGRFLYAGVRGRLKGHDLVIGNLEGTLGNAGTAKCGVGVPNCFSFQAPARAARGLRWAGFDVMNVANNHALDFGPQGQLGTISALYEAGIRTAGLPGRVQVFKRRGTRIAVVAFSTYRWTTSMLDSNAADTLIARANAVADVVVVVMHAGAEGSDRSITPDGPENYLGEQRGDVRAFARRAIDYGADAVLGSGPHVLRGMEVYRDRLVAYSLGNFAGVKNFSTSGDLGISALLSFRLTRDGTFIAGYLHPLALDASGRPTVDPAAKANAFVRRASERDFPGTAARLRSNGKLLPPRSPWDT